MQIKWFGHSCFYIVSEYGTKILTDPYDETMDYASPKAEADFVLVSHDHFDHNNYQIARGSPTVIRGSDDGGEEISLEAIRSWFRT